MSLIFSVSGVAIKNGAVLLTMEKGEAMWSCPSFVFDESQGPADALVTGMKKSLNIDVEPAGVIYRNDEKKKLFVSIKRVSGKTENTAYEKAKWIDTQSLANMDVTPDARLAILKYELESSRGRDV